MTIPESQLEPWTHQGGTAGSQNTYAAVKNAIDSWAALSNRGIDVYLQGSYRNSTNIRGESDVDVVVHCPLTFYYDVGRLSEPDRAYVRSQIAPATYRWPTFRQDVYDALASYFGASSVRDGDKCIKVWDGSTTRVPADVVPAFDNRIYTSRYGYVEGIAFLTQREGRKVISFPEQHYESGVAKQQSTLNNFKPVARMFKNATERAIDMRLLDEQTAPSYFVECSVWNVPDLRFYSSTWQGRFIQAFDYWCGPGTDWGSFMCVNDVRNYPLTARIDCGTLRPRKGPERWNATRSETSTRTSPTMTPASISSWALSTPKASPAGRAESSGSTTV